MHRTHMFILAALLLVSGTSSLFAQAKPDDIIGTWLTAEGESKVEIYKTDDRYFGKIVWLKEPNRDGKPKLDDKNPDEKLRSEPVLGLIILRGFKFDEDNVWNDGKIYDPKSGNDYTAKMTLVDEKNLDLRGYVLVPLFGRTTKWTRE